MLWYRTLLLSLVLLPVVAAAAAAQSNDLPPGVFMGGKDLAEARAGTYAIDPDHSAVLARVSHLRYSYLVFRFDKVSGKLTWDPGAPEKSTLSVSVPTASISSNVKGFPEQLTGEQFLDSGHFPEATFVSTAFHRTDATHGKVEGNFTLRGKTRPVTFEVELIGAGKGWEQSPRLGVHAKAVINPQDYGFMPLLGDALEIAIDTEFGRQP
jgi:polyisoprenoid-binding protein YceI